MVDRFNHREESLPPDLLQPTLASKDDLGDFHNPWNPDSLIYAAFFAGPVTGGYLIASNFKKLGLPDRFGRTFGLFMGVALLVWVGIFCMMYFDMLEAEDPTVKRLFRFGANVVTILVAVLVLRAQKVRFRLFAMSGGEPTSLWGPGLAAVFAGILLNLFVIFIITFLITVLKTT